MNGNRTNPFDVAVIGAGMAGMATSLFAARRDLSCVQVGNGGGILFASGLLDLLGVHPVADRRRWDSPFEALASLRRDLPDHPLARVGDDALRAAFQVFVAGLGEVGLPYAPLDGANHPVLTSIGTLKTTWAVPRSMIAGVEALRSRPPCLLVDFRGLREFSARQVVATIGADWPGLHSVRIEFPGFEAVSELYAAHLARAIESDATRDLVAQRVRPLLGDATAVGFPAVLGLSRSGEVHQRLQQSLGLPVFEIPTMPTSVPGLRLKEALESTLAMQGVVRHVQAKVTKVTLDDDVATLSLDDVPGGETIRARSVVLATGRFTGGGLSAGRGHVSERILDLPVHQPGTRGEWHRRDFLDSAGHPVNRAGLATDGDFRPLAADGRPAWHRLFATGSILAHQDWMREKCGSGLAIGTAWTAVEAISRGLQAPRKAG